MLAGYLARFVSDPAQDALHYDACAEKFFFSTHTFDGATVIAVPSAVCCHALQGPNIAQE